MFVSDVDHHEHFHGPDQRDLDERADEQTRERRWAEFVTETRHYLMHSVADACHLTNIAVDTWSGQATPGLLPLPQFAEACAAFAESEGWDGVLVAIARAMREQQRDAAEVERRR